VSRTLRIVLNLTPDEASDLHSAVAVLRERRAEQAEQAEQAELDPSVEIPREVEALRLAVRARMLHDRVAAALDLARKR
jgi:hypothetical protein